MLKHGWVLAGLQASLAVGLAGSAQARDGFFIGLGLGAAEGNFSVDGADEGDLGTYFDVNLGHAWKNGFGLGGGLSVNGYAYEVQLFGEPVADLELTFTTLDLSAWYFIPVADSFEVTLRAGISSTMATTRLGTFEDSDESAGFHLGVGGDVFLGESFALQAEIFHRSYGVAFASTDDKEVSATGLQLGVRWR